MKTPIRIPFHYGTRALRLERNMCGAHDDVGSWCLWTHAAADFSQGTYMKLFDNGRLEQVTLYADGSESVILVKDEDGNIT